MRACYCDRCKKLFKADQDPTTTVEFLRYNEKVFDGDLCDDCQDKLEDWLEGKK